MPTFESTVSVSFLKKQTPQIHLVIKNVQSNIFSFVFLKTNGILSHWDTNDFDMSGAVCDPDRSQQEGIYLKAV